MSISLSPEMKQIEFKNSIVDCCVVGEGERGKREREKQVGEWKSFAHPLCYFLIDEFLDSCCHQLKRPLLQNEPTYFLAVLKAVLTVASKTPCTESIIAETLLFSLDDRITIDQLAQEENVVGS